MYLLPVGEDFLVLLLYITIVIENILFGEMNPTNSLLYTSPLIYFSSNIFSHVLHG